MGNNRKDIQSPGRRRFIHGMLGTAASAAVTGKLIGIEKSPAEALADIRSSLCFPENGENSERFWTLVKEQFPIRDNLIMLNAANLCPSPYPVQQMVFQLTRSVDRDPSSHNRSQFQDRLEESRLALASYLGADADEIAITRNTSEGNNMVINGLTFRKGDEVVIWDENHPTANIAWDIRAERYGFKVTRVQVPEKIRSSGDLIQPFEEAMTPRTRLMSFSHLSNLSGIALPAGKICRAARKRGILTHVDGAQTFGSQEVNLHEMGCDFYTGSAHKWFMGPKEVGILYVRENMQSELWPTIVGVGYPQARQQGARKFETLGQRDDSRIAAMKTAVEFHRSVGVKRIESRVRELAGALKKGLLTRLKGITFRTPLNPEFSGGVVVFHPAGLDLGKALDVLYQKHGIGCAVFGGELGGIRMCPHIYNTREEIDSAVEAVSALCQ